MFSGGIVLLVYTATRGKCLAQLAFHCLPLLSFRVQMPCSRPFSNNCWRTASWYFSAGSGIQSSRPLRLVLLFWFFFYSALSSFSPNNEWWHLSQVCTVALPEMIACIFGQAPFPLKDIVSICCNDRIMASHLVLHPHLLARTNIHTCTRIHMHTLMH